MAPPSLRWTRGVSLGLVTAALIAACGPSGIARRTVAAEADASDEGGAGGDSGSGGAGATGGTGGAMEPDASVAGSGGTGGNPPPDAAPMMADMAEPAHDTAVDLPAPDAGGKKTVLLVMGFVPPKEPIKPGDDKLRAHLEGRGFTVKFGDDDDPDASNAMGVDLIIVSDTNGAKVGTKYTALPIPVICLDYTLMDDLKMVMTASTAPTAGTKIAITDMASPLAGGLMGTVTVTSASAALNWGAPPAGAKKVATVSGQAAQIAIFGYPKGAMMIGMTAPANRVGLFISDAAAVNLTDDGWKLFDAAVDWATQ